MNTMLVRVKLSSSEVDEDVDFNQWNKKRKRKGSVDDEFSDDEIQEISDVL